MTTVTITASPTVKVITKPTVVDAHVVKEVGPPAPVPTPRAPVAVTVSVPSKQIIEVGTAGPSTAGGSYIMTAQGSKVRPTEIDNGDGSISFAWEVIA